MRVRVVGDRRKGDYRECRRLLCGMGVNEPDPFPGYAGFVGWETPCVLASGERIVSFSAGYWHASLPTPVNFEEKTRESWARGGCPMEIDAPRGGRAMLIRSCDAGRTWSRPATIIDSARDDRHPALCELDDGTVLCLLFGIDGWYGYDAPPSGRGRNSITGVIRSFDGAKTFEQKYNVLPCPFQYYERMCAGFVKAHEGSVLAPTYGMDAWNGPCRGAVYRSTDHGATWTNIAVLDSTSSKTGVDEPALAEVAPGKLVVISRPEGDVFMSDDMGATWTAPVTFGMRMYAPKLLALRDGTLLCLFGSYCEGHGGFRAIWSTDGGRSWIAPAKDHGFIIDDSVYGYGAGVEIADGSVWCVYYDPGVEKQRKTGIRSIRIRVNAEKDGLDILPVPGAQADAGGGERRGARGTLDADAM